MTFSYEGTLPIIILCFITACWPVLLCGNKKDIQIFHRGIHFFLSIVVSKYNFEKYYDGKEDTTVEFIAAFATLSKRDSLMAMISLHPVVSHLHDLSMFVLDDPFFFSRVTRNAQDPR